MLHLGESRMTHKYVNLGITLGLVQYSKHLNLFIAYKWAQ
jgi:hypothetical protein